MLKIESRREGVLSTSQQTLEVIPRDDGSVILCVEDSTLKREGKRWRTQSFSMMLTADQAIRLKDVLVRNSSGSSSKPS
jgi:hypothetical protein